MKKVHLIITKIEKDDITATAVVFTKLNEFEYTQLVTYKETSTDEDILNLLDEDKYSDVISTLVGKRPPRRR